MKVVICTDGFPHCGVTDVSYHDIARALAENVNRVRAGLPPLHCVNFQEAEKVRRQEKKH